MHADNNDQPSSPASSVKPCASGTHCTSGLHRLTTATKSPFARYWQIEPPQSGRLPQTCSRYLHMHRIYVYEGVIAIVLEKKRDPHVRCILSKRHVPHLIGAELGQAKGVEVEQAAVQMEMACRLDGVFLSVDVC